MIHDDKAIRVLISDSHVANCDCGIEDEEFKVKSKAHTLAGELVHLRHAKFDLVCLVSYLIQNIPQEKLTKIIPHT